MTTQVREHYLAALDASGDNKITWGESKKERDAAKAAFDDYRRRGFTMFAMDADEEQGERMTEFDPEVAGIIAVPQLRGG